MSGNSRNRSAGNSGIPGGMSAPPPSSGLLGVRPYSVGRPGSTLDGSIPVPNEDAFQNLSMIFGSDALTQGSQNPNETAKRPYYIRPEALSGRRLIHAQETLFEHLSQSQSWFLELFPIHEGVNEADVTEVSWDTQPWDPTAELAPYRIIGSRMTRHRQKSHRRALGFSMEVTYMMTPEGVVKFAENMKALAYSAAVTMYANALKQLLTVPVRAPANVYETLGMALPQGYFFEAVELEVQIWGMLNFQYQGLRSLLAIAHDSLASTNAAPMNMLVLPYNVGRTIARNPENSLFLATGKPGSDKLAPAMELGNIGGVRLVETQKMAVGNGRMEDQICRPATVGEFFLLDDTHLDGLPSEHRRSEYIFTHVYDFRREVDNWRRISYLDALENSGMFDDAGNLSYEVGRPFFSGSGQFTEYLRENRLLQKFQAHADTPDLSMEGFNVLVGEAPRSLSDPSPRTQGHLDFAPEAASRYQQEPVYESSEERRGLDDAAHYNHGAFASRKWYDTPSGDRKVRQMIETLQATLLNVTAVNTQAVYNLVNSAVLGNTYKDYVEVNKVMLEVIGFLKLVDTILGSSTDRRLTEPCTIIAQSLASPHAIRTAVRMAEHLPDVIQRVFVVSGGGKTLDAWVGSSLKFRQQMFVRALDEFVKSLGRAATEGTTACAEYASHPENRDNFFDFDCRYLTHAAVKWLLDNNFPPLFHFMLVRPYHTWMVGDAIALHSHGFGVTGLSDVNLMMSYDTAVKRCDVHGSMHTGAFKLRPHNCRVMPGAWLARPLWGEGTRFWNPLNPVDRRNFADGNMVKDMFAIPIYPQELEQLHQNVIDLRGRFPHGLVNNDTRDHYAMHATFCRLWGIEHNPEWYMPQGHDTDTAGANTRLLRGQQTTPTVNHQGVQDKHGNLHRGASHFSKVPLYSGTTAAICNAQAGALLRERQNEPKLFARH